MEEKNVLHSAEKPFKYMIPTLEHMASVKLVLTLWSERKSIIEAELMEETGGIFSCCMSSYSRLNGAINKLSIPDIFKKKLWRFIEYFNERSKCWYHYHAKTVSLMITECPIDFYWTSRGSIDYTKTAEIILNDDRIKLIHKYVIACTYCFEDKIAELFFSYSSFVSDSSFRDMFENNELVRYWTMKAENELFFPNITYGSRNRPWINDRSLCNDRVLLHYWNNAGNEEKLNFISCFLKFDKSIPPATQYIFYLLLKLDKIMLNKVLHGRGGTILITLLDDIFYHDYFLQIAARIRSEIPDFDFGVILEKTCKKIQQSFHLDMYYVYFDCFDKLCEVLDIVIPRQSVRTIFKYFEALRWKVHFDRVRDIISCMSTESKQEILTFSSYDVSYHFVVKNQLDYLKEFVRGCLSTRNDIDKFKEHLIQLRGTYILSHHFAIDKLTQFESFVEWITENDDEKMNKLKKTMLLRGLTSVLGRIKKEYAPQANFTPADNYLKWCLTCDEDIVNMKISIAENYVMRKLNGFNQELIHWLFENDEEKIEQFLKLDTPVYFENILDFS